MPKGIAKNGINKGQFKKGHIPKHTPEGILKFKEKVKGNNHWTHRLPYTEKHKQKQRDARAKQIITLEHCKHISESHKGEKNPMWKGGVTPENKIIRTSIEYRLWREAVFARDNWTCQKYKIKGGKLHPHHILNFSTHKDLRFAIDNGITLSEKAHREFHKKYGIKNNTREQLLEFINKKND